jgi:AcrR family transcriptional regulator
MKSAAGRLETTRRAILDALAHTIVEAEGLGFSVQQVADRAGVTHRTVYNHFPTRDALSEGLAIYLEERLAERHTGPAPDADVTLERLPETIEVLYRMLETEEIHARAYVLLMMANRAPPKLWRARMRRFEAAIPKDALAGSTIDARQFMSALRMFGSTLGWHVLTEHCGLSSEEAAETAAWAMRTLIATLDAPPGRRSKKTPKTAKGDR